MSVVDCLAAQIPRDVRYLSRIKIFKEGCQGDVNINVTVSMCIDVNRNSFTLQGQRDLEILLKTEMLNFTNKGAGW